FSNVWRLKIVHRTRAMPLSQAQTKVRKISGVIHRRIGQWNRRRHHHLLDVPGRRPEQALSRRNIESVTRRPRHRDRD
ncbi:MAG: hypothetical protein E7F73_05965, partial [Bifidobacterium longum]|nr:hypothetical protein [Bifidobacterium longum]